MSPIRLVTVNDAQALSELIRHNRDFLAPWRPVRDESYFTPEGQEALIRTELEKRSQGTGFPCVIVDEQRMIVGQISLNGIVRGAFQSCAMGYWVSQAMNGQGLATAAVNEIVRVAFEELGLHRVQAETLLHNVRSQRVLEHNGFVRFGMAPAYLNIAGKWQDHAVYQKLSSTMP